MIGIVAKVALVDESEQIWARYPSGAYCVLDPDDGPDLSVGDLVLVQDENSFVAVPADLEVKTPSQIGLIATVALTDESGRIWARYPSGAYSVLDPDDGPEVSVGDLVFVQDENKFVAVPADLKVESPLQIGVIRKVEGQRSLVDTDGVLRWLAHASECTWKEWSTVEWDQSGIHSRIADRPLRHRDDPPAVDSVRSRFHVDAATLTDSFEGIAGLDKQIEELRHVIDILDGAQGLGAMGLRPIRGVLLAGESGTGKTMLARAFAKEANAEFFQVRGPEIASKWINESEEMLRALMDEADSIERAVVFFDEIDSLGAARSTLAHETSNKLITQFLTLMDGFQTSRRALIMAATNRPEVLDPALLRSGRFDQRIDFGLPDVSARAAILRATSPHMVEPDLDAGRLASLTEGWCSADLRQMWTQAYQFARREDRKVILELDCEVAIARNGPAVRERRELVEDAS